MPVNQIKIDRNKESGAHISECQQYRYLLWRSWDQTKQLMGFIMLNPSTADEKQNDPTISRCIKRAENLGYGGMYVINLFALRSTDPKNLYSSENAIGPANDDVILSMCQQSEMIICAWGNHGKLQNRGHQVIRMLKQKNITPHYLKMSNTGHPMHPLYISYDLLPQRMEHHD